MPKHLRLNPLIECIAVFNVSPENRIAIYTSGRLNSREYARLIEMLEFDRLMMAEDEAQAIEAQRAEPVFAVSVEDESAVGNADVPKGSHPIGSQIG